MLQVSHRNTRRSIIRIEYFVSLGGPVSHRATRRLAAAALAALLLSGASKCQHQQDGDTSSSDKQGQQGAANSKATAADKTCAKYRIILNASMPTKAERKLKPDQRLRASYKKMQAFYAAFAGLFPEAATAGNALSIIYGQAYDGTLSKADERKIGGFDHKITKVIDKHCPENGYPTS